MRWRRPLIQKGVKKKRGSDMNTLQNIGNTKEKVNK